MKNSFLSVVALMLFMQANGQMTNDTIRPSMTEIVNPIHKVDFNNGNQCPERKQGGDPKMINGYQVFNGSMDGNRQVDPQVAVGGGYVMEATNSGLMIYNKKGEFVQGVSKNALMMVLIQNCLLTFTTRYFCLICGGIMTKRKQSR